jgi:hypothetical protein
MASEVDICNKALLSLGASTILSLDDEQTEAHLCKQLYADLRDAVLQAHDWSWAIERVNLPKSGTDPTFRYANAFPLPARVLYVMEVNKVERDDPTRDWQVENDAIVSDDTNCSAKLLRQVTDTSKFSPLFIQALQARLAADMAIPLTSNGKVEEAKWTLYRSKMSEAASRDGQQGKARRIRSRWLENARLSSGPRGAGPVV